MTSATGNTSARAPGMPQQPEGNFKEMLYARFGRSIAEKFLIPYNEKLYATDLAKLDRDAMGRFFPYADLTDIVRNMKQADNASYNATFTYPAGGAIEYVKALASEVDPSAIRRTALVTIEGERDDICAVGQTLAAQDLCSKLRPYLRTHYVQPGVGHYGVFSGRRWQNQIYPLVRDVIHVSA